MCVDERIKMRIPGYLETKLENNIDWGLNWKMCYRTGIHLRLSEK
jgi:hypothetical protein